MKSKYTLKLDIATTVHGRINKKITKKEFQKLAVDEIYREEFWEKIQNNDAELLEQEYSADTVCDFTITDEETGKEHKFKIKGRCEF